MANAAAVRPFVQSPAFQAGRLVMTAGIETLIERGLLDPTPYLIRHLSCDWGDLCNADRASNNRAITEGDRLLSAYKLPSGGTLWIITEWDRSATTLLLPNEY